ncbi:MAG: DUF924 domain-containing protein [Gammaproteobacteria bacterium]|nr:DUF924 domain-containing protein [Gammaproteobacteria bacterium]NNJ50021.1 DUF924 domain-containing protein [Gammaproteobacteria bacterium]
MTNRIEDILHFWFGAFPTPYTADATKYDMWFKNGAAYDSEIFINFGVDYDRAVNGELDHWVDSYRGRLALIILLDQFSRHIHRGTAQAFSQDEKAQALCTDGIGAGDDSRCHAVERSFFYLPLEHAEDIEKQELSVRAFTQLVQDVPEEYRKPFESSLSFARSHHYVIEKFGRFPELNEILERDSTAEEIEFIASGKYSFL